MEPKQESLEAGPLIRPLDSRRLRRRAPGALYDLSLDELAVQLSELGGPAFRARRLYHAAYRDLIASYAAATTLPAALRNKLETTLPLQPLTLERVLEADRGETVKFLFRTFDGHLVETVLMFYPDRATVCVPCQVGCAVGCAFCATGLGGLERNLTTGEMVAQVMESARVAADRSRPVTNVVMMGMGEPFHNFDATMRFIRVLNDPAGMNLGARRFTVSTSGVIPGIDKLAAEPLQVNLAISLHAPGDELRSRLVPINARYPIPQLMDACRRYIARTGRRISFEYALMKGINDGPEIAADLAELVGGLLCHVNIIPLNPVDVLPYERPDRTSIDQFATTLESAGVPATVRYSRGLEIDAACGQLRAHYLQPEARTSSLTAAGAR